MIKTHASLFSGIGAAEIAADWMGWQSLFHCEIQEFPRRVLEYWYPLFVTEMMGFPSDWLVSPFQGGEPKP